MAVQELTLREERGYRGRGHLARAWSRLIRKKLAVVSIAALVLVYSLGIFAPVLSRYPYTELHFPTKQPPSLQHWAGTDRAGRDIFTRTQWGIQNTVILTVVGMLAGGLFIGVTLGLVSGYFGGLTDAVIMRALEVLTVIPTFFLVLIIAATLKPRVREGMIWLEDNSFLDGLVTSGIGDYIVISVALVIFGLFGTARLVRGQVLYLKETQYVEAAKAIGASTPRILFRHILSNAMSPLIVTVTMAMGSMVGVEIFLSWVGIGIQPPRPSLGLMLWESGHISVLRNEPWILVAPGLATWLMIFSWTLLGDALNDVLNPRTR